MQYIETVCGKINPDDLGMTLAHEHCLVDVRCWWKGEPAELSKRHLFSQSVTLENRGDVVYNNFYFLDNLILTDVNNPIKELKKFIGFGGSSIVDMTSEPIGRDPIALRYISKNTGANIIMGSGFYIESSLKEEQKKMSKKDIAKGIIEEFDNGVGDTNIKPGIIGETGISNLNNDIEIKMLKGAGIARNKIGCTLNIHPPIWETQGHKILDILQEEKVDLNKVVLSHCDPTLDNWQYHDSLAKKGCYIEYDQFGMEIMTYEGIFLPSDGERIRAIKKQIELGNIDRILISGDLCFKICFTSWGGWGYSHIPEHIIPRMKQAGITKEQIYRITVENPKKMLSF